MPKVKHTDLNAEFRLQGIELLSGSLALPQSPDISLTNFNFTINIDSKADAINKLIFMIVTIEVRNENQKHLLGTITASCIYYLANYEKIVNTHADGRIELPQALIDTLNAVSISTTRGIMFSTFKGTFLHNAILPIVNPTQFKNLLVK